MSGVAKRQIPADPSARALLIAERLRSITGRQTVLASCWRCGKTWNAQDTDGYRLGSDGFPFCADESECDERAARAGLVLVLGEPAGDAS